MGGRSRAAAQLLSGKGFKEVYNLKGGIKAWKGLKAFGPYEGGLEEITGEESAAHVIILAYGMEEGLREFYLAMARTVQSDAARKILLKLAEIELAHKNQLFSLYQQISKEDMDQGSFEKRITSQKMEGGFTTEEFLEHNSALLERAEDIISTAMMLETQSLDLYLRFSASIEDQSARDILFELSEQEKRHLKMLGDLLERYQPPS